MRTHLKVLESELDCLTVKSQADGNMRIEITYKDGPPGLLTRLEIAEEIGELIYQHIGKIRHRRNAHGWIICKRCWQIFGGDECTTR